MLMTNSFSMRLGCKNVELRQDKEYLITVDLNDKGFLFMEMRFGPRNKLGSPTGGVFYSDGDAIKLLKAKFKGGYVQTHINGEAKVSKHVDFAIDAFISWVARLSQPVKVAIKESTSTPVVEDFKEVEDTGFSPIW